MREDYDDYDDYDDYEEDEFSDSYKPPVLSRKISSHLELRLENNQTNVYIDGVYVKTCMDLKIIIPIEDVQNFDQINSIDDLSEHFSDSDLDNESLIISPEEEFWGHCSNIQAWVENDYDTRILHSNIAFPLLRKLTNVGDLTAKNIFKEEIAKRFASKYLPVALFLYTQGYLNYLSKEEFESLLNFYEDLSKIPNMKNPDIWAILGICYRFLKLYFLSEKSFKNALNNSPGNRTILINLAELYYSEGDFRKFRTMYMYILEKNPNDIYVLEGLADVYLLKENLFKPSINLYEYILRSQPDNLNIMLNLALAYSYLGKNTKSSEINLKLLEINPRDDYCWVNLGINYFELGDFNMAKRAFLKALEFNDSNYKAGANLIRYYINRRKYERAFLLFNSNNIKYQKFAKNFKRWDVFVLDCLIDLKEYKEAKSLYDEDFKFTLDSKLATFYDGKIHFYMKNFDIAEKDFDFLISENPKCVDALYYKASINAKKNEVAKTLELLKEIDKLDYKIANDISSDDNFKNLRNVDKFIEFFNRKFSNEKIIVIDDYGKLKLFKLNIKEDDKLEKV